MLGEEHGDVRRLTLQPGERLDRDFILRFRLGGDAVRTSLSLHPDAAESGEGTFALTIVPPLSVRRAVGQRPRDVVLLLDRSGSMERLEDGGGPPRHGAAWSTRWSTPTGSPFSPSTIGSRRRHLVSKRRDLIPATDRNRFKAVEFLAKLESRGGTEIAEPLDQAVKLLDRTWP